LLAQKQELIARLQQEDIGPEERDEIERLLEKIEAALDLLEDDRQQKREGLSTFAVRSDLAFLLCRRRHNGTFQQYQDLATS
jgi:hypothetical protein